MSDQTAWYSWLSFPFFAPLSGAVSQKIAPELYQGSAEIEQAVTEEVASFGKQLGVLSDAVLELAAKIDPEFAAGKNLMALTRDRAEATPPLEKLHEIAEQVRGIKDRYKGAAEQDAKRALERLKLIDPAAYRSLASGLRE